MTTKTTYDGEGQLFDQVERMVRPIIVSNAGRFRKQLGMTKDEAIQEARIALMLALRQYDYNDSRGGIYRFVQTSVRHHFTNRLAAHRRLKHTPHVVAVEGGKRTVTRVGFECPAAEDDESDFIASIPAPVSPSDGLVDDGGQMIQDFHGRLTGALAPLERNVLKCKTDPPADIRMMMIDEGSEEPTVRMIGAFLGLTRNQIDWSTKRIREVASRLVRQREFSDLAVTAVVSSYLRSH